MPVSEAKATNPLSRVGRRPIKVPQGVEVNIQGAQVIFKSGKGTETYTLPSSLGVKKENDELQLHMVEGKGRLRKERRAINSNMGSTRAHLANVVKGLTEGFKKELVIIGVGWRAQMKGKALALELGYSEPVEFPIPEDITAKVVNSTEIVIEGTNKEKVGKIAAEIREIRPVEPYKGKGVRYKGEQVIQKEVKKK